MMNKDLQSVKQRFGIIGSDPMLNHAIHVAVQVANTDLSVLITGESGVGKERIPQIIHEYSSRKHSQYIAVNCGAIPEGTIDSELFGHEKGSFTGAISDRKGYFEVADKGTIFLDEVGELPLTTQVRLLRVLETGEFIKVGSSKVQKCDVRVVAATNMNMQEAIAEGKFREDLYYRLNSVPIAVPPLRNRGTDIYLLFRKFAVDFAEKYKMPSISLNDEARQLLLHYQWPGNVRQLKNITEQISVLEENREITKEVLQGYLPSQRDNLPAIAGLSSGDKSFSNEREILYQVLFDMKKDMNDLKKLVNDIIQSGSVDISHLSGSDLQTMQNVYSKSYADHDSPVVETSLSTSSSPSKIREQKDIQEVDVEESLSLEDAEKELIRKALEKNNNKRKYAAQDLNISERTLYRKIKEYGLE
jgi:transcriptional regulator with PAS, ATPase and Fis domain